jgi:NDP-sugar pyrophosphorylase family protein
MKVIVPCCGQSSRYPGQPPKWMLPAFDGRPMICHAVSGLPIELSSLVVTILDEHQEKYRIVEGLQAAFGQPINVVRLSERTRSQAETIARTLEKLSLDESFLVKDSDNTFHLDNLEATENFVCVDSLNNFDSINPRNKSYVQADHKGLITNIREKVVISDLFNVGGYFFLSPGYFGEVYQRLTSEKADWQRELYLSDMIGAMILEGTPFRARQVRDYHDWGTVHEWRQALLSRKVHFVSLDGFVFERGSPFFHPRFADVRPNEEAIRVLQTIARRGDSIVYLSIRAAEFAALTTEQLTAAEAPLGQVIYGCSIAPWQLITAPHASLSFQSGTAIEVNPSDPNLAEKLVGDERS